MKTARRFGWLAVAVPARSPHWPLPALAPLAPVRAPPEQRPYKRECTLGTLRQRLSSTQPWPSARRRQHRPCAHRSASASCLRSDRIPGPAPRLSQRIPRGSRPAAPGRRGAGPQRALSPHREPARPCSLAPVCARPGAVFAREPCAPGGRRQLGRALRVFTRRPLALPLPLLGQRTQTP